MTDQLVQAALQRLLGRAQGPELDRLRQENAQLKAALAATQQADDAELSRLWQRRGKRQEGEACCRVC